MPRRKNKNKNNNGGAEDTPYQIPEPTVLTMPEDKKTLNKIPISELEKVSKNEESQPLLLKDKSTLNKIPTSELQKISKNEEPIQIPEPEPEPLPLPPPPIPLQLPEPIAESSVFKKESPQQQKSNPRTPFYLAIGLSILALVLLIVGLYILLRPPKFNSEVEASITAASCKLGICTINISYTVYDKTYTHNNINVHHLYAPGQTIKIDFDSNNPNSFILTPPSWIRPLVGGGLSLLAVIIIVSVWWYYSIRINI
jgi:hypothetical protein